MKNKVLLSNSILKETLALVTLLIMFLLVSCKTAQNVQTNQVKVEEVKSELKTYKTIGNIERIKPEINSILPENAVIEVLSDQLVWAEGPLWIPEKQWLLCSDVMENRIHKWSEKDGFSTYLEPSGFTGDVTDSRERGSNGLILDSKGVLTLCQHGNRQVAKMNGSLDNPKSDFISVVNSFEGKKLNSPNDLVYDKAGNLYFTDPPYGLSEALMEDPKKELPFQGVFKLDTNGKLTLLTDKITRPNGLAFSPDEKTLYVANTDPENAQWLAFEVKENKTLGSMKEILNVTHLIGKEVGYPDGIKVDQDGNIFTAGPGGLWIFNADLELIGKIKPGEWVSNCAFDNNYETLYLTADDYLLRIKLSDIIN